MNTLGGFNMKDILTPAVLSVSGGTVAYKAPSLSESTTTAVSAAIDWTFTFQVVGAIVGVVGIVVGILGYFQRMRANDIAQDRLDWEKQKHAEAKDT